MIFGNPILLASFIMAFAVSVVAFEYPGKSNQLNIVILAFTAVALIWTTVDARKNSLEALRADLRPVILRDDVIPSWDDFKKTTETQSKRTSFFVANNIAANVTGYVVVNGKQYDFSFTITKPGKEPGQFVYAVDRDSVVAWTLSGKPIVGETYPDRFIPSTEPEGIYVFYTDVEGNKYKTYEDSKFKVTSAPI